MSFCGDRIARTAELCLCLVVLDNQDGFIQAGKKFVSNHIYRSGDSEYKIDGKKVRLSA